MLGNIRQQYFNYIYKVATIMDIMDKNKQNWFNC